jgi:putative spermidine/putrescine transport system ATP-binding protein
MATGLANRRVEDPQGAAPEASAPTIVAIEALSKGFSGVPAVLDVSLQVARGEFLTILGPSGCGKTTLLRMVAGFLSPDAGRIMLGGRSVGAVPPHARSIGMVFQRLALFPHMSVGENVRYPLRMRGFPRQQQKERVARYLDIVRLPDFEERYPHELSGGQQQRVAIARALVFEPELLLLDEPLSSLDRNLREEMQGEFKRIQRMLGVTTINVTHDQKEALLLSDRVAVMRAGRVEQAGPPREVYRRPATLFVAGFLGSPNLLDGVVTRAAPDALTVRIGEAVLPAVASLPLAAGERARLLLRVEHVRVEPVAGGVATGGGAKVSGIVTGAAFEGERSAFRIRCPELGGIELRAFVNELDGGVPPGVGDVVDLHWERDDLVAFPARDAP